jgi:hypothetical protein
LLEVPRGILALRIAQVLRKPSGGYSRFWTFAAEQDVALAVGDADRAASVFKKVRPLPRDVVTRACA